MHFFRLYYFFLTLPRNTPSTMKRTLTILALMMALLAFVGCNKQEKAASARTDAKNAEKGMSLWDIATSSYSESNPVALAAIEDAYSQKMAKMHPAFRKGCIWLGWAGFAMMAVFLIPAIRRSKVWNIILLLPFIGVLLLIGKHFILPTWLMMVGIPCMVYVACYPLLYTGLSRAYVWINLALTIIVSACYFWIYWGVIEDRSLSLIHLLLWIAMVAVSFVVGFFPADKNFNDVCPHCGYFANHSRGAKRKTGSDVSYGSETDTIYDGTTERTVGNTKYITKHYHDEVYETETTTSYYDVDRSCMRCGKPFTSRDSSSQTTRRRVR